MNMVGLRDFNQALPPKLAFATDSMKNGAVKIWLRERARAIEIWNASTDAFRNWLADPRDTRVVRRSRCRSSSSILVLSIAHVDV